MDSFSCDIANESGVVVGHFSGTVCNSIEEVFQSMDFITDGDFIQKWELRIPGGIRFPCSVLSRIEVSEEFENIGLGAQGIQQFNLMATNHGAIMAIVRIGWQGYPPETRMAKSLHFYEKTGWTHIPRVNELEHHLAYRFY